MNRITSFVTGAFGELRRVEWPTRRIVLRHTIYIVISVVIAAIIVGLVDVLFTKLLSWLLK